MSIATLTSKGQMTIPKDIRDGLDLKPQDQVHLSLLADGTVIMRAKKRSVRDLYGALHRRGRKPIPVAQMKR
ncbi:MAG TPA: type II toxin-antitoxin system PrlF family antitoxin [Rhizomicrobium sp.]